MGIAYSMHTHAARYTFFHFALRVVTGLLLLLKGLYFISHSQELHSMILQSDAATAVNFLVSYISFAHLFGGAFIMLGLLTKLAVLLQIPIVVGALYYNMTARAFGTGPELLLSIVVLVLLIYLMVSKCTPISMDEYLKKHLL